MKAYIIPLALGLLGCGTATESGTKPSTTLEQPVSLLSIVNRYASQMAKGTPITNLRSQQLSRHDSPPQFSPDSTSFTLISGPYRIRVDLNQQRQPDYVFISAHHPVPATPAATTNPYSFSPPADRLIQLGELRRVFGPGKTGHVMEVKEAPWQRHPISFNYQPNPNARKVVVAATLPSSHFADSSMVHAIGLYVASR
ncbi:hypothetical protein DNI29_17515 [Hymenobacter sediminis]|uniref:hypothetical protein n=1 Tax=Hymenobacter sediminis TaxID=2218621 RepID=UPI000DA64C01|nr:hypothetical protein [Hymenobacter sediminis]RPD45941.1 hypothetical protein DNI29_17515 [Hymenobacter sediminis]